MRILKSFLLAWFFYWLLLLILPVRPIGEAVLVGFLVQIIFVLVVAIGYVSVEFLLHKTSSSMAAGWRLSSAIVPIALSLSLLGTLALAFDKIVVQGIDYSAGLAYAREQWREAGAAHGDEVSSAASVVGYLLGSCYIVAVVLFSRTEFAARWQAYACGVAAAILALANTVLTGGRSTLILTLLFFVATRLLGGGEERSQRAGSSRSFWLTLALLFLGAVYFLFVIVQRADATGISVAEYSRSVLTDLGLRSSDWFDNLDSRQDFVAILNLLVMAVSYFVHSFATTVAIVDFGPDRNTSTVIFVIAASLAAKLHLIGPIDTDWFLAGAFPSLPGALYLQGGWFLLVLAGVALGLLTALVRRWYIGSPSVLSYGLLASCLCTLLASPILFVADVMMFPFVIIQFCFIYLIAKAIK